MSSLIKSVNQSADEDFTLLVLDPIEDIIAVLDRTGTIIAVNQLEVKSEPGKGACVRVVVPMER
jgi:hypothetical protein